MPCDEGTVYSSLSQVFKEEIMQTAIGNVERVFETQLGTGKERYKMDPYCAEAAKACMASRPAMRAQEAKRLASDLGDRGNAYLERDF